MTTLVSSAIDHYHWLLENGHFERTRSALDEVGRRGLLWYDRPICSVLRPEFITDEQAAGVFRASGLIVRALTLLANAARENASLLERISLHPDAELVVRFEPPAGPPLFGRLDGFLGLDDEIRFIEHNSTPAGLSFVDSLGEIFDELPIVAAMRQRFDLVRPQVAPRGISALRRYHAEAGGSGLPRVGIVASESALADHPVVRETRALLASLATNAVETHVAPPEALEYSGGKLLFRGAAVDVVVPVAPLSECQDTVLPAIRDGAVRVLGGAANSILLGNKALFSLLTEPDVAPLFDAETLAAVRRHVPWTRTVREGRTHFGTSEVDLLPFLSENRDRFVLKPAVSTGGAGVRLGWECSGTEWDDALKSALDRPHVVQERVSIPRDNYPLVRDGRLAFEERLHDLNPYVWNGADSYGAVVRLTPHGLINVGAGGGSSTPLYIVRSR